MSIYFDKKAKRKEAAIITDRIFIAEVAKELKLRKWTQKDLAEATGLKLSYIKAFMAQIRYSEKAKEAIAEALEIEI